MVAMYGLLHLILSICLVWRYRRGFVPKLIIYLHKVRRSSSFLSKLFCTSTDFSSVDVPCLHTVRIAIQALCVQE